MLSLFIALLEHGLIFEGAASFIILLFYWKEKFTLCMFLYLALLMFIKRPEAVKMFFLKLIPF